MRTTPFVLLGIVSYLFAELILFIGRDESLLLVTGDVDPIILALLVVIVITMISRRVNGDERSSWVMLAVAFGLRAFGEIYWAFSELVLHIEVPTPSIADVGWHLSYIAIIVALGYKLYGMQIQGKKALVGLTLTGATLAALLFAFFQGPVIVETPTPDVLTFILNASYVVYDIYIVALLFVILAPGLMSYGGLKMFEGVMAAGFLSFTIFDVLFAQQTLLGTYVTGSFIDFFYDTAYVLILLAAHVRHEMLMGHLSGSEE